MSEQIPNIPPNTPMHIPEDAGKKLVSHAQHGPVLGALVLLLAVVLVGLYLWGAKLTQEPIIPDPPVVNNEPETPRAAADTAFTNITSPSDELSAIEADLSSTQFDLVDSDLTTIDAEMNQALGN